MALPQWMRGRHAADDRDVLQGKRLPARGVVNDADLHYRVYDAASGELLSFGSMAGPGALDGVARDVLRTQAENPGARLRVVQADGPAYPTGGDL